MDRFQAISWLSFACCLFLGVRGNEGKTFVSHTLITNSDTLYICQSDVRQFLDFMMLSCGPN